MKLGFVGLGRMGNRMVTKLLSEGQEVVVWNRTQEKVEELKNQSRPEWKLTSAQSIEDLVRQAQGVEPGPKIIWSMLPAGDPTENALTEILKYAKKGDIVVDGGNAKYTDTQRRYEQFTQKGIDFLGIGVSGGIVAAKEGYPLMVGGSQTAYEYIMPILDALAKPGGGHEYFGQGGAGHFVKMVHNGIEYAVMQGIGEGFGVLEKSPYGLDLLKVAQLYQKGTLNSGFMMQRTIETLESDPKLSNLEGYIEASGEGDWTVEEAQKANVPIDVIKMSLDFRTKSREDKKISSSFAARMVAALRLAFGGHATREKQSS